MSNLMALELSRADISVLTDTKQFFNNIFGDCGELIEKPATSQEARVLTKVDSFNEMRSLYWITSIWPYPWL